MSIQNNICTPQELKRFADSNELTIDNFSKFIQDKTNQEHLIVQKEFVKAISKQLFSNNMSIFDINRLFNEAWEKIIRINQNTTSKWKKNLKAFED